MTPILLRLYSTRLFALLMVLLVLVSSSMPLLAQDERVTVRIDGRPVFRVGPALDADAETRARRIEARVATLLATPEAIVLPARVEVSNTDPENRIITVSGVTIATVTPVDAEDNLLEGQVQALAEQWASALSRELAVSVAQRTTGWGRFATEVRASLATAVARLSESALRVIPGALAALLVITLFWLIAALVRWLIQALLRSLINDLTTENLIKQLAYYAVWLLGIIIAAGALGFDPQTAITGLGFTGVALGFALRDIISNFVSGILILVLRPFQIGDQIVVGDTEGSVERIVLRATQIRTYDGRQVLVPNADVFTSRVTNNTASPVRRGAVQAYVGYDVDLRRAFDAAREAVRGAPGVMGNPEPAVLVSEFTATEVVLEARFWTDSRRADFVATASAVRQAIVDGLREAGIALPDPSVRVLAPRYPERWRAALGIDPIDRDTPQSLNRRNDWP